MSEQKEFYTASHVMLQIVLNEQERFLECADGMVLEFMSRKDKELTDKYAKECNSLRKSIASLKEVMAYTETHSLSDYKEIEVRGDDSSRRPIVYKTPEFKIIK